MSSAEMKPSASLSMNLHISKPVRLSQLPLILDPDDPAPAPVCSPAEEEGR